MGFENNLGIVRKLGRKLVLPAEKIKIILSKNMIEEWNVQEIIDMGSGTLYWSDWFAEFVPIVNAVDIKYDSEENCAGKQQNIRKIKDINSLFIEEPQPDTLVWMCDVLHHLEGNFSDEILDIFMERYNYIAVKDINKWHKFGNFMNRLHDRIVNGKVIRDIDPYALAMKLQNKGFKVEFTEIRRLWYPHFLIIAQKKHEVSS